MSKRFRIKYDKPHRKTPRDKSNIVEKPIGKLDYVKQ
jgi:hypothetical protein